MNSRRDLALMVIATAQLMVVLDSTIVNVALPHVQRALGFSGSGLEWVVNAYAVTFGGLLLLNTAQQVGGAIGLAVLGTVAWTTVADSLRAQLAHAGIAAKPGLTPPAPIDNQALTDGFSVRSRFPPGSGCSPCSSRSPPSGSAAGNWPAPGPSRTRRHRRPGPRSQKPCRPGPRSGRRTGPPAPRRSVPAGSASRPGHGSAGPRNRRVRASMMGRYW
jgi:hypothetical protein